MVISCSRRYPTRVTSGLETHDGIAVRACGDVLVVMWREASRIERIRWLGRCIDERIAANESVVCCQIILASSSPPDAPARREGQALFERTGESIRRLVTVPVGDDLWMSIVRTILRGMAIVSRQPVEQRIASNLRQGLDYVHEVAGPRTPQRHELAATVPQLCAALEVDERSLGQYRD
jgi:hypothetical protein